VPLRAGSFDEWWTRTLALAGPLSAMVAGLPADRQASLRARLDERARPYVSGDGLDFPGMVLLATVRR
jgi:hypothetical protein